MAEQGPLATLFEELRAGRISRREFLYRGGALGVGMPVLLFLLNGVPSVAAAGRAGTGGLVARDQAIKAGTRSAAGTETQKRGEGGELKLLQWQAPTILNAQIAQGVKDVLACMLYTEPLMCYLPDGSFGPILVKEVPTQENGLLAKDLTTVTYNLLDGVTWSDGQPFTSKDVAFTWKWIMDPANASPNSQTYSIIKSVETPSDTQVKFIFDGSHLDWYVPFVGFSSGGILPEHVLSGGKSAAQQFLQKPIGTGPFVVETFRSGDQVSYVANDKYREPNKPYFARVNLKGGGDAPSAARAVMQTGDWDYAWNMQVEPEILKQMQQSGGKGKLLVSPGAGPEMVLFNFSDPNKEVDGQRSYWKVPHPFFSDKAVRQAVSLATDRSKMSTAFYSGPPGEPPTSNVMLIPGFVSKDTSFTFDIAQANKVLDDAGWKLNGNVREKNGVKLAITYATSINSVRQKEQALNKANWEKIGFQVTLRQVDAGIYFDTSVGNEQSIYHFYVDIEMYTNNPSTPYPLPFMLQWYAGPNGDNIDQKSNQWNQNNTQRYNNPAYDKLYDQAKNETDPEKFGQLIIQMNDMVINDYALVPMVQRANVKAAVSNKLNVTNIAPGPIEFDYYNIANWNEVKS